MLVMCYLIIQTRWHLVLQRACFGLVIPNVAVIQQETLLRHALLPHLTARYFYVTANLADIQPIGNKFGRIGV